MRRFMQGYNGEMLEVSKCNPDVATKSQHWYMAVEVDQFVMEIVPQEDWATFNQWGVGQ